MATSRSRRRVSSSSERRRGRGRLGQELPAGKLLRKAREKAGFTQQELAGVLRCTQQAIAQAERAQANHTVEFLRRWAKACKRRLSIRID